MNPFSFDGRRGRLLFFIYYCLDVGLYIAGITFPLLLVPAIYIDWANSAKRMQDFGLPGKSVMTILKLAQAGSGAIFPPLLAIVQVILLLVFVFIKGDPNDNKYGPA